MEGIKMNISDSRIIQRRLYQLNDEKHFERFDRFLIKKIVNEKYHKNFEDSNLPEEELQKYREEAYHVFYKKIKLEKVASRVTIKKWFGLDGYVRPRRMQIIRLAFALGLNEEELQEYLIKGILQPGIQINDYREMIFLYGLVNKLSYVECINMIEVFETRIYSDTVFEQNTHTLRLWNMFRKNYEKPKAEFLSWMCKNAGFFKGYSKVALRHFMELKSKILDYIRENAKEQLFRVLEETDFFEWAEQNGLPKEVYGKNVTRYIKNVSRRKEKGKLTEELKGMITELNWVAYSSRDKTTDLLAELYASAVETDRGTSFTGKRIRYKDRKNFNLPEQIFFMTDKYISQIVGVAQQKEKEIRLSQALGSLKYADGACPEWIKNLLAEYRYTAFEDAEKTKKLIANLLTKQRQRCHLVQREDLLPLIHYVAQKKYERTLQGLNENYRCKDAKMFFVQMADMILEECQMAPISEEYQLDYLLLSCYGKNYMYSLADVIEEAEIRDC